MTYAGSNATVVLAATDAGSGASQTSWRVDGGPWSSGRSAIFDAESSHVLEYFSVDVAGNTEQIRSRTVAPVPHVWIEVESPLVRPDYGSGTLQGVVRYGEQPLSGAMVVLDRSMDGVNWTNSTQAPWPGSVGPSVLSRANGALLVSPALRSGSRSRSSDNGRGRSERQARQAVGAILGKRGRAFKVSGVLAPRHASGSRATLVFERLEAGKWVPRKTVSVATKPGSGGSVYSFKTKLSGKGKWRVAVQHEDESHSRSTSSYRAIRVK